MIKKFNTHPKAIISILAALILFSIIFFKKINLELFPPYTYPAVTIECSCPGEIAEVIEKKITIPLEQVFNSIDGIENISSTSEENKCEIILEFAYGSDINIKIQEIKEKIRYVKQKLPDSIQKLRILKYSSQSDPAIIIALTSNNLNLHQLRYEIEKNIKKEFLLIKNIANVEIFGGKEEKILVDIEQQKLFSYNLNVYNINKSLATGNVYNPLGQITHDGLEFNLQALSSYKNIKQIKNTAVFNGNKSSVFIRNVGNIKKGYLKEQVITKINGKKTVALYIYTRTGSNILNISKKVIKKIKSLDKKNKNFTFTIVYNQAKFISKAINELLNSGKWSLLFTFLVLLFFTSNLKKAVLISFTIPLTILLTIGLMYLKNLSLNVITISGLTIGIGMIIDSSIIVSEKIDKFILLKKTLKESIILGLEESYKPLLASTITTLVVFIPIFFFNDEINLEYGGFAWSLGIAIFISFFISTIFLGPIIQLISTKKYKVKNVFIINKILTFYLYLLKVLISYKYIFLFSITFIISIILFQSLIIPQNLMSGFNSGNFVINIEFPPGTLLETIKSNIKKVENDLLFKNQNIDYFFTKIEKENVSVNVQLKELKNNKNITDSVIKDLEEKTAFLNKYSTVYFEKQNSNNDKKIELEIYSHDYSNIIDFSSEFIKKLNSIKSIKNYIQPSRLVLPLKRPEIIIQLNKQKLKSFNISPYSIGRSLRVYLTGEIATDFQTNVGENETVFRVKNSYIKNYNDLKNMELMLPDSTNRIFLKSIADIYKTENYNLINRKNGERFGKLIFYINKISFSDAIKILKNIKKEIFINKDISIKFGKEYIKIESFKKDAIYGFILSILLMYLTLVGLYQNFFDPFIIMLVIPISISGVIFFLLINKSSFSAPVYMGIIVLTGIIVNNSVVMLDEIKLQILNNSHINAVINAASQRFSAILQSNLTTILGMTPLILFKGSSEIWKALGNTIISGLIFGTVGSLIVTPLLFISFNEILKKIKFFSTKLKLFFT